MKIPSTGSNQTRPSFYTDSIDMSSLPLAHKIVSNNLDSLPANACCDDWSPKIP